MTECVHYREKEREIRVKKMQGRAGVTRDTTVLFATDVLTNTSESANFAKVGDLSTFEGRT